MESRESDETLATRLRTLSTVDGFEKFIAWTNRQREAGKSIAYGVTLKGSNTVVGLFQVRSISMMAMVLNTAGLPLLCAKNLVH